MKKQLLVLLALFFIGFSVNGQKVGFITSPNLIINDIATNTPMQVAWDPNLNLYYISTGGQMTAMVSVFNANGEFIASNSANFDDRGIWYDPQTGYIEGNGFAYGGYGYYPRNDTGMLTGDVVSYCQGYFMPNTTGGQAAGAYDTLNHDVIFYDGMSSIYIYNLYTGANINAIALNLPNNNGAYNNNVIYTGITGSEIGLYDYINHQVDLFSYTTGSCVAIYKLPASASSISSYGFSYANGMVWLNDNWNYWYGYLLKPIQNIGFTMDSNLNYTAVTYLNAIPGQTGNSIIFTSSDSTIATCSGVNGSTLTAVRAGICMIYATEAGDTSYLTSQIGQMLTVIPDTITISGVVTSNKIYDQLNVDTLTGGSLLGVKPGDSVSFTLGLGTFASADAGTNIPVATNIQLNGPDSINYYLLQPTGLTANIVPDTISISGVETTNQEYGATIDTLIGGTLLGVYSGDDVSFIGVGEFESFNLGNNIPVISNIQLTGNQYMDYYLVQPTGLSANILTDTITVQGITASNIVYNTSNQAVLTGGYVTPAFPTDTINLTLGTGTFESKNVGTAIPINASGYVLTGAKSMNYYLKQPTGLTADILPDTITISGVMTTNQVYNGTTMDTLTGGTLSGVYTLTDTVNFNLGMGTFAWAETGTNIPVTTNIQLTGPEAGNYYLLQPMGLTANIAPEQLIIAANADSVELGYQDTVTTFTYTIVAGMLQGDDMLMGSLYCNLGDTVGQYGIEQGTLTAGPDYVITFDTAIFAITAVPTLMKAATVAAPSVYPNPTKGPVQIDAASGEVSIVSMDGTVLERSNLNTKKGVDLTGKAAGVYFLILKTDTGTYQYKVIKQ